MLVPFSGIFPQAFGTELHTSGTFRFGNRAKEGKKRAGGVGFSYPQGEILHPILHPKLPGFIGVSHPGCRKCRRFSKNFFYGREEECRNVFYTKEDGNPKTSDFFGQKYGGFALKVRMFYAKKSDVLEFPSSFV